MSHHPSCRPHDRELVWYCNQCGEREEFDELSSERGRDGRGRFVWIPGEAPKDGTWGYWENSMGCALEDQVRSRNRWRRIAITALVGCGILLSLLSRTWAEEPNGRVYSIDGAAVGALDTVRPYLTVTVFPAAPGFIALPSRGLGDWRANLGASFGINAASYEEAEASPRALLISASYQIGAGVRMLAGMVAFVEESSGRRLGRGFAWGAALDLGVLRAVLP